MDRWFNVDAGFERNSGAQLASNLQTLSSRFSGIRAAGTNNPDLALIKNTTLREGVQLQFRAEGINALKAEPVGRPPKTMSRKQ